MPDVIAGLLRTSYTGHTLLYTQSTGSTNDDAKELSASYPEGTVFIAEIQSSGKGRIGRDWSSPPGGVFMSVLLRPAILPSRVPALSLVAGYSVAKAIRDGLGLDAQVKWPNDVLVDGRKICGILCEMRAELDRVADVVVGIGVNANLAVDALPPCVRETGTSLRELLGRTVDRNSLIADILNHLESAYGEFLVSGLTTLGPRITELCAFLGRPVVMRNLTARDQGETHGTLQGIDSQGRVLLSTPGGNVKSFSAGDLSLRPAP